MRLEQRIPWEIPTRSLTEVQGNVCLKVLVCSLLSARHHILSVYSLVAFGIDPSIVQADRLSILQLIGPPCSRSK